MNIHVTFLDSMGKFLVIRKAEIAHMGQTEKNGKTEYWIACDGYHHHIVVEEDTFKQIVLQLTGVPLRVNK
jgi:hypothetical protein